MSLAARESEEPCEQRRRIAFTILIVFLAFAVRAAYVVTAKVEYPIRGDVNQYVLYAWNLTHRGVFSTALPDAEVAVPDSYRGPGYPAMLALTMKLAGHADLPLHAGPDGTATLGFASDTWMRLALWAQVILGALSVLLTILTARFWLSSAQALFVGAIVALWPHLVTFTGALLSETLFCFIVALSVYLLCAAERKRNTILMLLAGLSFGLAYLVNPVIAIFPLIVGVLLCLRSSMLLGSTLLLAFMVAPCVWALRNANIDSGAGAADRAAENFVVGSWPQFYAAYNSRFNNEISAQIIAAEGEEQGIFVHDHARGLALMRERMLLDPGYFAGWYLLTKPFLLWDWAICIGSRDLYFLDTQDSPFDRFPFLRMVRSVAQVVNPVLFVFALGGMLLVFVRIAFIRRLGGPLLPIIPAGLFAYVTIVHVVLQAEPRYSIPFRPIEILLACWVVAYLGSAALRLGGHRTGAVA